MLLERYQLKNGSGLVNYRDFVNSLDRVFSDEVDTNEVIQNAKTSAVSYKNQITGALTDRDLPNSNRSSPMRRRTKWLK